MPAPTGKFDVVCVRATRGIKRPLSGKRSSRLLDASGVIKTSEIHTFCPVETIINAQIIMTNDTSFFIFICFFMFEWLKENYFFMK